jgi:hypothetical protein
MPREFTGEFVLYSYRGFLELHICAIASTFLLTNANNTNAAVQASMCFKMTLAEEIHIFLFSKERSEKYLYYKEKIVINIFHHLGSTYRALYP